MIDEKKRKNHQLQIIVNGLIFTGKAKIFFFFFFARIAKVLDTGLCCYVVCIAISTSLNRTGFEYLDLSRQFGKHSENLKFPPPLNKIYSAKLI